MNDRIKLIVGLGNPGEQYAGTRHNAGADLVAQLAAHYGVDLSTNKRYFGLYAKTSIANQQVHLLIPTTFMNNSGQSVGALANFHKIPVSSILVIHDELDLPPGTARFKQAGGHGGHNGLRDIISHLGKDKNFYRLRIGIGHPGNRQQVSNFVLNKAPTDERQATQTASDEAIKSIELATSGQWEKAMNRLHSFSYTLT